MLLTYFRTLRDLNRNVLLYLAATSLLGFAVDGGVFSVLFNLYLLRLGFGPEFIGQMSAAGLLAFSFASLLAGSIGERLGHRAMMVVGLILMAGSGFFVPLAEFLPTDWIALTILTLYISLYVGMGFYYVNAVPFVMSISTDDERNRAFSMQTAFIALAAFAGSLGGGLLPRLVALLLGIDQSQVAAYRYPLMIAAALLLPSIYVLFRIRRPTVEILSELVPLSHTLGTTASNTVNTAPIPVRNSRWGLYSPVIITLLMLSTVRFFQVSGVATVFTFFNVYMDTQLAVSTENIGLIIAAARLFGVFAALSTPILVSRWGAGPTVLLASLVGTFSILPLAFIPYSAAAGIGFIGVTAISSMRFPAFMIFATGKIPPNWRGTLAGVGEFAGGLSFTGLAFIGGSMAEKQGFSSVFLLGGALSLTGAILFYIWFILPRNKQVVAPVATVSTISSEPLL